MPALPPPGSDVKKAHSYPPHRDDRPRVGDDLVASPGERGADEPLGLGRRVVLERLDEVLVGGRGLAERVQLDQAGARVRFGDAGAQGVVSQVSLVHGEGGPRVAVGHEPVAERQRVAGREMRNFLVAEDAGHFGRLKLFNQVHRQSPAQ